MSWEYLVVNFEVYLDDELDTMISIEKIPERISSITEEEYYEDQMVQTILDYIGIKGWELISILPMSNNIFSYTFKKSLDDNVFVNEEDIEEETSYYNDDSSEYWDESVSDAIDFSRSGLGSKF